MSRENKKEINSLQTLDYSALKQMISKKKEITYAGLCKLLNIPQLSGNSKIKQLNQLDSICEYEKRGTKYLFLKMRSMEEMNLYNNRSIYVPYIEYIISQLFYKEGKKDNIIFFNTMELLFWCNMVNQNYKEVKSSNDFSKIAVCVMNNFNLAELNFFIDNTYEKILKPIVRSALKSMDNKKSITINKGYKLYSRSDGWTKYKEVLSTSYEGKVLSQIEADCYTELGIKSTTELMFNKKNLKAKYRALANEKCKDLLGYDGFYNCYAMVVNTQRIQYNITELKKELNQKIKNRVLTAKSLDTLTNVNRKIFIDAMIDEKTEYDFKTDIINYQKVFD